MLAKLGHAAILVAEFVKEAIRITLAALLCLRCNGGLSNLVQGACCARSHHAPAFGEGIQP
jgi:hypothetical protein